jgi:hypothetical protein
MAVGPEAVPARTDLGPAVPTPFRIRTVLDLALAPPEAGDVRVRVYDMRGRLVRILLQEPVSAGVHAVAWDGLESTGSVTALESPCALTTAALAPPAPSPIPLRVPHLAAPDVVSEREARLCDSLRLPRYGLPIEGLHPSERSPLHGSGWERAFQS